MKSKNVMQFELSCPMETGSTAARSGKKTVDLAFEVTAKSMERWEVPSFQRPVTVNARVKQLAEHIQLEGVIPGRLSIGVCKGKMYRVDCQHRLEAFKISGLNEAAAEVEYEEFDTMRDMAKRYLELNEPLKRMGPNDKLKAMELYVPILHKIRKECPFVGYSSGRSEKSIPMSRTLSAWAVSAWPQPIGSPGCIVDLASTMTDEESEQLIIFLHLAKHAWGLDSEYSSLWRSPTIVLCMWLYRTMVLDRHSAHSSVLTAQVFTKCMMSLSSDQEYLDWIVGKNTAAIHTRPAYVRIKNKFIKRARREMGQKISMPAPEWST